VVANAGESWSAGVAEHGMAMLLALVKCLPESVRNQTRHAWDRAQSARMGTLEGLTAAIVGYGSIGRAFARLAKAFGMRVVGLSRSARPTGRRRGAAGRRAAACSAARGRGGRTRPTRPRPTG
jgi:phosphoglycerate dehydrogenase-like enzyme